MVDGEILARRAVSKTVDLISLIARHASNIDGTSSTTTTSTSSSASTSCAPNDSSPRCELPAKSNSGIAIGLGIAIPVFVAFVMFVVLSIRHRRLVKKEDEEARAIEDNDDGFTKIPLKRSEATLNGNAYNNSRNFGSNDPRTPREKDQFDGYPQPPPPALGSKASMTTLAENPFETPGSLYQLPELNPSQASLSTYDPFEKSRYPNSEDVQEGKTPKFTTNPYGAMNSMKYASSQQALNSASTTSLPSNSRALTPSNNNSSNKNGNNDYDHYLNHSNNNTGYDNYQQDTRKNDNSPPTPPAPRRTSYEETSNLSKVPTHTPSTAVAPQFPAPETASNVFSETAELPSKPPYQSSQEDEPSRKQEEMPPRAQKGVQFSQEDIEKDERQQNAGDKNDDYDEHEMSSEKKLSRSDTKNFDRVKSVYKEYFPSSMHSPEHKAQEMNDHVPEQDLSGEYQNTHDQGHYPEQHGQQAYYDPQQQGYYDSQQDYYDPQQQGNYDPQQQDYYDSQQPSERPNNLAIDTSLPMPPSAQGCPITPRTIDSQASVRSNGGHVVHTRVNKIELSALPVPHNLSDNVSAIEYSKIRRNYENSSTSRAASPAPGTPGSSSTGAGGPEGSAYSPFIPVYNPLDNNLMYPEHDAVSSNVPLPSPAQLRQSIAYMTNLEFQRPKKYNNDLSDSLSSPGSSTVPGSASSLLSPGDGRPSTPAGARAMIGIAPRVRPPSELVPDSKTQFEKLRPTMEMR